MILSRRGIIGGLIGLVAAPAIVKYDSIMPVRRALIEGPYEVGLSQYGDFITITDVRELRFPEDAEEMFKAMDENLRYRVLKAGSAVWATA